MIVPVFTVLHAIRTCVLPTYEDKRYKAAHPCLPKQI